MKLKQFFQFAIALVMAHTVVAQETTASSFKPHGTFIIRGFVNYSAGIGNDATPNHNSVSGFDVTRAFLGYNYDLTKNWSANIIFDAASGRISDSGLSSTGYYTSTLRTAFVSYHNTEKGYDISFGQVNLQEFNIQEGYWGHRYVYKSFQDQNKFGQPVDLGVIGKYKFNDLLAVDLAITNGEGYKKVNSDNRNRYGLGLSLTPIKGLMIRAYGDIWDLRPSTWTPETSADYKAQRMLTGFVGYKAQGYSFGAEYDYLSNVKGYNKQNSYGYSFFGIIPVAKQCSVYARYDNLSSKDNASLAGTDGQTMIFGFEYSPMKQLKFSPNVQNFNPTNGKAQTTVFLNVDINVM